jgi:hypothetical protein
MRRPLDVGQAGLLVMLLLGASGCAGFPQRSFGTAPQSAPADGQSVSPPGLFSRWHRSSSKNVAEETASVYHPESAGPGQRDPLANQPTANPWPESQSEWVARNFPRFNRLWNGSTTRTAREPGNSDDDLSTSRASVSRPVADTSVTASAPRSDGSVRPTEGPSSDDGGRAAGRSEPRVQNLDDLPFSPTPPPVRSPRQSAPDPTGDPSSVNDDRAVPIPADISENAENAALQPKGNPAIEPQQPPKEIEPDSAVDRTSSQPQALDDILPAPASAGPQESLNSVAESKGPAGSTAAAVAIPVPEPQPAPPATSDTRMAQAPPPPTQRTAPAPPPPSQRTPPAPPPPGADRPAASPPEPPPPAAATPAEGAQPAAATATPPPAAAPAPVPATGPAQAPASVSSQRPPVASKKTPYSSPSHMTHPQSRHHLLSWLFHEYDDDRPLPSSQLPPAAFPATYSSTQSVLPTGHGNAASCETADKAPKKPCFLKVWIHDWKNGHGSDGDGCGHGGVCASDQASAAPCETAKAPKKPCFLKVWIHDLKDGGKCSHGDGCGQGGVTASPQGPAVCETAAKAPKKPCFLKVWIHDWKSGHGSGCGSCQKGGGSGGKTCQCCGGGGAPVSASAQGNIASAQAKGPVSTRP